MGTTIKFSDFLVLAEAFQLIAEIDSFIEADSPSDPEHIRASKKATLLDPKTGSKWRADDRFRQLDAILQHEKQMGTPENRVWVTFSDVSKLGQRMQVSGSKSTPVGIFAFPATYVLGKKGSTPFSSRAYMHVFRIKTDHYEVGRTGGDDEEGFGKIKSKFNIEDKDPVPSALRVVRSKFENFIYKTYYNREANQRFKGRTDKDNIYTYLNELLSEMMDKLSRDYQKAPGSDPQTKISGLDLSFLDKTDDSGEVEQAKQSLIQYISSLTYYDGDEYVPRWQNINPDLSAELSPGFITYVKDHRYDVSAPMRDAVDKLLDPPDRECLNCKYAWPSKGGYPDSCPSCGNTNLKKGPVNEETEDEFNLTLNDEKPDSFNSNYPSELKEKPTKTTDDDEPFELKLDEEPPKTKRFTFDQIEKMDRDSFDSYSSGYKFAKKVKNAGMQTDPLIGKFKKMLATKIRSTLETFNKPKEEEDDSQAPHYDKFKFIADKYGLDLKQAVRDAFREGRAAKDEKQYLYRGLQGLAKQYSKKNPKTSWQMAWNKFFRDIGISSIADTEDSGYVHSAESTQGVFMDPRDVTHITTIIQQSHANSLDPASRPTASHWGYGSAGMHSRTIPPVNQRKGPLASSGSQFADKDAKEKTDKALEMRLGQFLQKIAYSNNVNANNVNELSVNLTMVLKLMKSKLALKPDGISASYSVVQILKRLETIEKTTPATSMPPQIKKQIDEIRNIVAGQKSAQKFGKWSPTDDERAAWFPPKPQPPQTSPPLWTPKAKKNDPDTKCDSCDEEWFSGDVPDSSDACPHCGSSDISTIEMQQCGNCGKMYPQDEEECPKCDKPSGYNPDEWHDCESCGNEFSIEDNECPNCGYDPNAQHCAKCDSSFPEDDSECPHCGAEAGYDPDDYQKCDSCDKEFSKNDTACPHCGYDPDAPDEDEEEPEPAKEETPDETSTQCLDCGTDLGMAWSGEACPSCGSKNVGKKTNS